MHVLALWPLWLLLALAPLAWITWRNRRRASPGRLWSAFALRALALVCTVLALMRPSLPQAVHELSVVYALDISRSISPRGIEEALRWIEGSEARSQQHASSRQAPSRLVLFADRARLVDSPQAARALAVSASSGAAESARAAGSGNQANGAAASAERDATGVNAQGDTGAIAQDATNVEDALLAALDGFPAAGEKHLVLISDGNATAGDVWRALPRLQQEGVHVYTLPARLAVEVDAWPQALWVGGARIEQPVPLRAQLYSRTAASAQVTLEIDGRSAGQQRVALQPGITEVAFTARFQHVGANAVRLAVQAAGDEVAANDRIERAVWVGPRPRVLQVEGNPDSAHYLADALRRQSIQVQSVGAAQLSANPALLAEADVLILSDVPAGELGPASAPIERFVRDRGGGLVFAAGEQTYGKEGFAGSAIERSLPVTFEGKRKKRDIDLVLLIDRSFSMRGRKLELAKSAALATLDLLEEEHRLAVIGFDAQPREVVPLAAVGNKRRAEDLIASMTASGQTSLYPALLKAQQLLAASTASTRHVILLSDGVTAPVHGRSVTQAEEVQAMIRDARADVLRREGGTFDDTPAAVAPVPDDAFARLALEFKDAHISLSTIAVGERPNIELMTSLAEWAGGKHYAARDDSQIPSLFVAETQRLLGASIVEQPFRPLVKTSGAMTDGIDLAAAPPLKGFVVARPKRFAEVLLEAQKDKPLLARTQYGLGSTVAFLSDVKNRWAADWLDWPGYGRLWAQVVRAVLPREAELLRFEVERQADAAQVTLTALDDALQFRSALTPRAALTHPDGHGEEIALRQVAPGRYEASARLMRSASAPTTFALLATGGLGSAEIAAAGTRSLFHAHAEEDRVRPADVPLLQALARHTGGRYAPAPAEIFERRDGPARREVQIWPWLAVAALAFWLLDVAVRRTPMSFASVIPGTQKL